MSGRFVQVVVSGSTVPSVPVLDLAYFVGQMDLVNEKLGARFEVIEACGVTGLPAASLLEVRALPAWDGVVHQWRAERGGIVRLPQWQFQTTKARQRVWERRVRYGFSHGEVADLIKVPVRTLHDWRSRQVVVPTVRSPDLLNIWEPVWCCADALAALVVDDLRRAGLPGRVDELVASSLQRNYRFVDLVESARRAAVDEFVWWPQNAPLANLLDKWSHWYVPTNVAAAEMLMEELGVAWVGFGFGENAACCERDPDTGDEHHHALCRWPGLQLVEYSLTDRVRELEERVRRYWAKEGTEEKYREVWLT